ncbi:uncharacterized protein LOC110689884 [Chenopodium quinoa]|uniref:uncharacterized protein LOC110689884 n=1 Tax=Chenopodium quinoa TaxID=63459 RepID=UPI000B76F994|nr:uncharacterized protein LOC110689884 [Chenopodium quinoa]
MIQPQAHLNVVDNSGARELMCIRIIGANNRRYARIGDIIVAANKEAIPNTPLERSEVIRAVIESLQIIKEKKLQVPPVHAVVVGSNISAQTKFETELRSFVTEKKIQNRVHFINKTLTVAPYLAVIDVLVQNSQVLHCLF